jgi:hypothetical protein
MKIELRKISFNERMSEETNAFVADVYVDGKKVGYAKNDGRGGDTWVQPYPESRELFKEVEKYCKSLPDETYEFGGKTFKIKSNIEIVVDQLLTDWLNEKANKQFVKKMETRLMWGVPNSDRYTEVNFKKPLNQIDRLLLQSYIIKYKRLFKDGEVFLNTNLVGFEL